MNDIAPPPVAPRRGNTGLIAGVLALLVLAGAGAWGWKAWQARAARQQAAQAAESQQLQGLEQRFDSLRRDLRAQAQRLQDAATTNRVLRDEVLALGQREALLEDTVNKLADTTRHGAEALRLDEVELLLGQAAQRLRIAGDLDGARRASALAAMALDGIDNPRYLNLRQALAQERSALDALGPGPKAALETRLDALVQALARLPREPAPVANPPAWQRLLAPLVQVRPAQSGPLTDASGRAAALDALQVEVSLARAALERGDEAGLHRSLDRIEAWLLRLWPDSPARRQQRQALAALRRMPLRIDAPALGTTLQQLRAIRDGRTSP